VSVDLLSLTPEAARIALTDWLTQRGEPPYRVRQVAPRLWQRPVASWADATDVPAPLRAALDEVFPLKRLTLRTQQVSTDGTQKFLWALDDGDFGATSR
jgi:23S rRNA (adenine2503-C2)-methyltransferase